MATEHESGATRQDVDFEMRRSAIGASASGARQADGPGPEGMSCGSPQEGQPGANVPYLVKVIRQALNDHASPRDDKLGCTFCQGALAALNQLVPEEADRG